MRYWITTHYPHPVPDTAPWHIYFRKPPATKPDVGDPVLFYETRVPQADRDRLGRKAIVCAAVVSGTVMPMRGIGPWVYQIPCDRHQSGRPVPLDAVRKIIAGPFFRQTLRQITREQYQQLAKQMGIGREGPQ